MTDSDVSSAEEGRVVLQIFTLNCAFALPCTRQCWMMLRGALLSLCVVLASSLSVKQGLFSVRKLASIGVAAALSIATSPVLADAIPAVGTPAPDFTLPSNAGKDLSLKDLSGKRTVLYFYPVRIHAYMYCKGCSAHVLSPA